MSNFQKKSENFEKSVARLQEALDEYDLNNSTTVRDGAFQRFEFSVDLAWKTTREYLLEQGFSELNSPKAVMREAYSYKIIYNEHEWIQILNDRNLTSHVYDEKTADEIFARICTSHMPALKDLSVYFCEKQKIPHSTANTARERKYANQVPPNKILHYMLIFVKLKGG